MPPRLPDRLTRRLRLPLISAPMLNVSGVDLVVAACRNGVVGAFPTLNARSTEQLDQWLAGHRLEPVTEHTLVSARQLRADLERSRERGYYATRGENVADVMAVAAALRLGNTVLGVAIAGPMHRMLANEARLGERLLQCVRRLEERNGK